MADFLTLSCPSCGAPLQVTDDIDRFACAHCGAEHVVKRGGGIVSLAPVVSVLRDVRAGVDRTASELALPRLTAEIAELEQHKKPIRAGETRPQMFLAALAGVVVGVVLNAAIGDPYRSAFGVIGGLVIFVFFYAVARHQEHSERAIIQAHNKDIDQQIALKRQEISRHRARLSG
jgi:ribosomal protein S27AE